MSLNNGTHLENRQVHCDDETADLWATVTDTVRTLRAVYSPQGDKIVFTSLRTGDLELFWMNADGSGLKQLTGAPGVLEDASGPHSLISYIDRAQLDKLRDDGKLADGMLPKAAAIDAALANGVQRVHVISYNFPDSLLLEVFTNEGTGTLVVNDIRALTPAEQAGGGS